MKKYKRKIYLQDKPRKVAVEEILSHFNPKREVEWMNSHETLGRITAEPIFAINSMPHYHASAMDGIAVRAEDTYSAHEQNPIQLKRNEDFIYVDTGNAIPSPFNAVIMIENVDEISEDVVEIIEPTSPWAHIRPIGEDIVQEEMLFPQGHQIRPVDIGVLLASQTTKVKVWKKPLVTVIPTGNELVLPNEPAAAGKLIEFNGTVISNFIAEWGGNPQLHSIVRDNPEEIKVALLEAVATSDIVVINAGSSAGSKDYTVHLIGELGEVFTHGVATRPGKPVILGKIHETIVVGIPGYPVSAYLALEWFVRPLVCAYLGISEPKRQTLTVKLGRRIVSTMGAEDYVRMTIGRVNGEYVANPLTRAAGVTMSLVKADGMLIVPPDQLGYEQGEEAQVELLRPVEEIDTAIVFNGSHDLTIDILSSQLRAQSNNAKIISSHVGSMAGIMAIKKGEAHIAGIHLLDPETKEYNRSYVKRFLADQEVVLFPFLKRKQGWLLPKGNPMDIHGVVEIMEKGALYVNRQKGAGTRILFDLLLKENGIESEQINGYDREMFSHLSVAAEVKGSLKAVGLGIFPAARAMGLDFLPVSDEEYDLLMTKSFYDSEAGQQLIQIIRSDAFRARVEAIGGYAVVTGEPIFF
ncbi:molybdopterin biosynthesis protein [Robertmurraya yapensis]|uniref:Molybdopterin molybdenumtransferase n=1 Tax=Bacillus yapensis TaxID=2492960 RepID=A0A431WCP3_9BACI|nr:molybdopterin biosynthesis protein [Bacillus yapensis]RTR33057.1 molybdopterin biosynthesis protein [Bacillus yapensis]TKS96880.1 molybdopterin biosynthesis protein [Bacillus yapensis]